MIKKNKWTRGETFSDVQTKGMDGQRSYKSVRGEPEELTV
jgi:hypothetical protein